MTNVRFSSLAEYRDIETTNFHRDAIESGLSLEEIMTVIYTKSRDNARTPMQWSGSLVHGGFTNGVVGVKPWIGVNPNYMDINVEDALNDSNSIFYYYQKLIQLRKEMPIMVRGNYDVLYEDHMHIFMYKRFDESIHEIIVACNFSYQIVTIDDSSLNERLKKNGRLLISNYDDNQANNKSNWLHFRAYETWVIELPAET
ncbi:unnamed protein product [Rotaria sp. Silwood2]|nr:unnamed protein product [Rotaria sp. Silwood2]CAF4006846.1 unnamed protein product [Rotaria sp. Silwood2]